MHPDYTLIQVQRKTPAQALAIWIAQMATTNKHASMPIHHWLWHDYAPTNLARLYTKNLIVNTIAAAKNNGAEFATAEDVTQRIRRFEEAAINVTGSNPITATVAATGVGQFSLRPPANQPISHVTNWYAYDNTQVFLPDGGGTFTVHLGSTPASVSRITELPMRARLLSVNGDGDSLFFSFSGEGTVKVTMSPALVTSLSVTGASSYTQSGNELSLVFSNGVHTVALRAGPVVNHPPQALGQSVATQQPDAAGFSLYATDLNNDPLTYVITSGPAHGQLTGTAPHLSYVPDVDFVGTDSFTYQANDGQSNSGTATISIVVTGQNQPPQTTDSSATVGQAFSTPVTLSATDPDGDRLTYAIVSGPASGLLTGPVTNLIYTPDPGFNGTDSFTFVASDGQATSNVSTVTITVTPAPEMVFTSVAGEDGWIVESTEVSNVGGAMNSASASGQAIRLGDDDFNRQYKSILSFNTAALPDNANIVGVRLELTRGSTTGNDALVTHGVAKVDIKTIGFGLNKVLQTTDFQAAADVAAVGTFTSQGVEGSTYYVWLGYDARSRVSRTNTTQLRLSLGLDDNNDSESTYIGFHSGGSDEALRPRLIVSYR